MTKIYAPAALWLVFITVLSVMPGVQLPTFSLFEADKLAHSFVYGVETWLLMRAFAKANNRPRATFKQGLFALVLSALYGAFMEWVQGTYFPGRFFEYDDMIANTFGAVVGFGLYWVWHRRRG